VALIIAFTTGSLTRTSGTGEGINSRWRMFGIILMAMGLVFSALYHASPFRTQTRDFQLSCYDAGQKLALKHANKVVTIGAGPSRIRCGLGSRLQISIFRSRTNHCSSRKSSTPDKVPGLISDLNKIHADAVMVWGNPTNVAYASLLGTLQDSALIEETTKIQDPALGEVGVILFSRSNQMGTR